MTIATLTDDELATALATLPGWTVVAGKLHREYRFADFVEAFAFMTACALVAERADHHPEWCNVWNRVVVDLTTHDAGDGGGLSQRDVELARRMDALARR